jgi:hypothetical protein
MQVLKFSWDDKEPFFITDGQPIQLFENEIHLKIGGKKCIGYRKNGNRVVCDNPTDKYNWQCDECKNKDQYFNCVRCDGECINPPQRVACMRNNYSLYLAGFGSLLKVGISVGFRLEQRLMEQGADFGVKVLDVRDGKEVRKLEKRVSNILGVSDRLTGEQKAEQLLGDPNLCMKNINEALKKLNENGIVSEPEIIDMRRFYRLENVTNPEFLEIKQGMVLKGRCVSAKGNLLVLDGDKVVNAHRMIGRFVEEV